jgi:hypothetical protein
MGAKAQMTKSNVAESYEILLTAIQYEHDRLKKEPEGQPVRVVDVPPADIKALIDAIWKDRNESEEVRTRTFEIALQALLVQHQEANG